MSVHSNHYETEEEYKADLAWEYRKEVDYYDRNGCVDCSCYKDCCEQVVELGYPQCENGESKFEDEYEVYEALQNSEFMLATYETESAREILEENSIEDIQTEYRDYLGYVTAKEYMKYDKFIK